MEQSPGFLLACGSGRSSNGSMTEPMVHLSLAKWQSFPALHTTVHQQHPRFNRPKVSEALSPPRPTLRKLQLFLGL
jgi:hypothetical protein